MQMRHRARPTGVAQIAVGAREQPCAEPPRRRKSQCRPKTRCAASAKKFVFLAKSIRSFRPQGSSSIPILAETKTYYAYSTVIIIVDGRSHQLLDRSVQISNVPANRKAGELPLDVLIVGVIDCWCTGDVASIIGANIVLRPSPCRNHQTEQHGRKPPSWWNRATGAPRIAASPSCPVPS